MERQRRQRARRHDQKRGLVLDQCIDRCKQRSIQFMGEREVEQPGLAGCIARLADIKPAAEHGNLLRQGIRTKRDRTPLDTLARHRENVAFLLGDRELHYCFIVGQQRLHLSCLQRQRIRQRGVIGKFAGEGFLQVRALGRNRRQPVPAALLGGDIALGALLRDGCHDGLVQLLGLISEILIPAHQLGEPVGAGRQPDRKLVHGGRCG